MYELPRKTLKDGMELRALSQVTFAIDPIRQDDLKLISGIFLYNQFLLICKGILWHVH